MPSTSAGRGATNAASTGRILIMAALPLEVRPFLRRIKARARRGLGLPAWNWEAGGAVVALSGMGAVAARRAGETLMARCRPRVLVSVGFAGALTPGLAAGDLVLGETFWHYDPDTRELKPGPQPAAPRPLPRLCAALQEAGLPAHTGSLVTTSRIIHKGHQGEPLTGLPQPVLDLETGALAALAAGQDLAVDGAAGGLPLPPALPRGLASLRPGPARARDARGAAAALRAALTRERPRGRQLTPRAARRACRCRPG